MSKNYDKLSDAEKEQVLQDLYVDQEQSFGDIAEQYNTYANKLRRDAKRFKIQVRNRSEAQKLVLSKGKAEHPTKGKTRTNEEKIQIGKSVLKSWENLTEAELANRKAKAKENWNNLSDYEKQERQTKANQAVRAASKTGSKLEHFLCKKLMADGFKVEFHREQSLVTTKLQIDIMIPNLNVAIEVDGPSHFAPVWGDDSLKRNKNYDNKKTGLILGKGLYFIRIKHANDFSNTRGELIYSELKKLLDLISSGTANNKMFLIEDK